jgi:hypothetical protein
MGGKSKIQSDSRAETYISHFRLEQGEKRLRGELRGGEKKNKKPEQINFVISLII